MNKPAAGLYFGIARVTALAAALHAAGAASLAETTKAPTMLLLSQADNDRTVDIHAGETVRLTLPENATTGYRWAIDHYDEAIVEVLTSEPSYPADAVGSGGEVAFMFRAKSAGTGQIALKYWRQWEGESSVNRRFVVRLHVQP